MGLSVRDLAGAESLRSRLSSKVAAGAQEEGKLASDWQVLRLSSSLVSYSTAVTAWLSPWGLRCFLQPLRALTGEILPKNLGNS